MTRHYIYQYFFSFLHLSQVWCSSLVASCNFSKIRDIREVSSSYITFVVRFSSVKKNSPDMLSISWMTNSKNTLNNTGGNKHPCLKPTSTANHFLSFGSTVTQHLVFLYKLLVVLMILSLTTISLIVPKAALKSTKSTKLKWTAVLCSYAFSKICLILTLCKKCTYSELFWSAFSRIRTKYWDTSYVSFPYFQDFVDFSLFVSIACFLQNHLVAA